jgi:regulatory protein
MKDETQEKALKRAFRFLGYRARSEEEVRKKLDHLGFSEENVEQAMAKLRSLKMVDDETFARGWALGRVKDRGYGPLRIENELREKGISQSLIGAIIKESFAEPSEKKRAEAVLEKRFRGKDPGDPRVLRRVNDFLQRRGYHRSVIAEILGQAFGND